jgi:hypothetical protein
MEVFKWTIFWSQVDITIKGLHKIILVKEYLLHQSLPHPVMFYMEPHLVCLGSCLHVFTVA